MPKSQGTHRELYSVSLGELSKDPKKETRYPMTKKKLQVEINEAVMIAKDCHYPESVITRLKACKTVVEIDNALASARRRYL